MKYTYIKKGINRPVIFTVAMKNTGTTIEDYDNGKWIPVTDSQADFYSNNPYASFDEIMAMEVKPVEVVEISIEEQYKQRVKELIAEQYSIEDELRIMADQITAIGEGKNDPEFLKHETFVDSVKQQVRQELGITSNLL